MQNEWNRKMLKSVLCFLLNLKVKKLGISIGLCSLTVGNAI